MSKLDQFSTEEIQQAYTEARAENPDSPYSAMAKKLSAMAGEVISRQLARWWALGMGLEAKADPVQDESELELMRTRRSQQVQNNKLRAQQRAVLDALNEVRSFETSIRNAVAGINQHEFRLTPPEAEPDAEPMTVELLLSDLQIGKIDVGYNTDVAKARLREFTRAAIFQIRQKQSAGYKVERVVLVLLGDIIESSKKHGVQSALSTDTSTPEQIANAIEALYLDVITPLALLGIPLTVHGVGGNHDHDEPGMEMFKPGRLLLTYPLYKSLQMLTETAGMHHVEFRIPEGVYSLENYYGQTCLYEHGVGVKATEAGVVARKAARAEQLDAPITYIRIAHYHNTTLFNGGQHCVNGSFFGANGAGTEYSSISGYSSEPSQLLITHCPAKRRRYTLYDFFVIRLGHIK